MKILFIEAVTNFGGSRMASVELAANLKNQHDVQIVDINGGKSSEFIDACIDQNVNYSIISTRKKSISRTGNPILTIFHLFRESINYFKDKRRINNFIDSTKPDYVILNCFRTLSYFYRSNHDYQIIYYSHVWSLRKELSKLYRHCLKAIPDKHICVSEATRHSLYNNNIADLNKITVIPNVISNKFFPRNNTLLNTDQLGKKKCCHIIHISGFLPSKGQHISIEIASKLKDLGFNFRLILVGIIYKDKKSKLYHTRIVELIKESKLEKHIEIVLNTYDVVPFYDDCHISIFPSQSEGFGRIAIESMAMNKPIIANPVGGVTDIIQNNFTGFLAEFNDSNDFASKIIQLCNDPYLYNSIVSNANSMVHQVYNKEKILSKINNIIK
jgi:glycosyltransferase involved in cell wall biosynthesis